jgi:hypothetical protein
MRRKLSRPSPAMVVALIALFVALGGSGYAATKFNPKVIKNNTVPGKKLKNNSLPGQKLRNNSVTGRKINEATMLTVPSATNAERFGGQLPGAFLEAGATAANSQKLTGLEPTSFVRRECDQSNGQNKGVLTLTASPTFSATFIPVPGYNCSGQTIEARRLGMGRYEVRFNGSPSTQAVVTPSTTMIDTFESAVLIEGPGLLEVHTATPVTFTDVSFTLVML